jgi:hypothetical protein
MLIKRSEGATDELNFKPSRIGTFELRSQGF